MGNSRSPIEKTGNSQLAHFHRVTSTLTKLVASLARNRGAWAISSGRAKRQGAHNAAIWAQAFGVSVPPGSMALARIPRSPHSVVTTLDSLALLMA